MGLHRRIAPGPGEARRRNRPGDARPVPHREARLPAPARRHHGHDALDRLARIEAETLVLVGAEDILTPPYESEELAANIPRATLRILPRGGHGFSGEFPAEFNAAVAEFLGR